MKTNALSNLHSDTASTDLHIQTRGPDTESTTGMDQPAIVPDGGCNGTDFLAKEEEDAMDVASQETHDVNNELTHTHTPLVDREGDTHTHPPLVDREGDTHTHTPLVDCEGDTHTVTPDDSHSQVMMVDKDGVCVGKERGYMSSEDSSSDSDSSSSSSSSSSCPMLTAVLGDDDDDEGFSQERKPAALRTTDEVLPEELPAVEEVCIILPEGAELQPMGTVSSIIQQLIIIQSLKETPPLQEDTVIFNSDRLAVGKVFEVFGPVLSPLYVVRFNSEEHIRQKQLQLHQTLYCSTAEAGYIFIEQLQQMRGSDASWKNDQEPPAEELDFSDDEVEQIAKKKKKKKKNMKKREAPPPDSSPLPPSGGNFYGRPPVSQKPLQQQQRDHRGFPPRREGAPFYRHQGPPRPPPIHHPPPPPLYLPPPCPYPPPFQPQGFPLYPPPPAWSPFHTLPFSHLPPPPPPPPPPPGH